MSLPPSSIVRTEEDGSMLRGLQPNVFALFGLVEHIKISLSDRHGHRDYAIRIFYDLSLAFTMFPI